MAALRMIGNTTVSGIGYGTMPLSASYGTRIDDEERFKFLDELHARGCTHWDTANSYGDSEELLGRWFKRTGKRSDIFLATKFGMVMVNGRPGGVDGRAEYCKEQIDISLNRLGVDYIDLYYLHRTDPKTPIEQTVGAMAELVTVGKVKYLGLSECSADTLRRAHAVHPISAVQVEYSIFTLDIESPKVNLLQTARELGVKIVAYSPLGRGMLTGRYRSPDDFDEKDVRRMLPRFSAENFPKVNEAVDIIAAIAKKHNASIGQVALAWLLAQGDDIVTIPGTTSVKNLDDNLGALRLTLPDEDVAEIRRLAQAVEGNIGERNLPVGMKMSFVDTPPLA